MSPLVVYLCLAFALVGTTLMWVLRRTMRSLRTHTRANVKKADNQCYCLRMLSLEEVQELRRQGRLP